MSSSTWRVLSGYATYQRPPYSQNIRTCLSVGDYTPTSARASACFPPHHPPYSVSRGAANAEGSGDGLETPAGVYHGDSRSGITPAERVSGDGKSYPAQPAHRACPAERRRTQGPGEDWLQAWQASFAGRGDDRQARHDSRLAPYT